jgi:sigma-E factor negative regulatory protein RseA
LILSNNFKVKSMSESKFESISSLVDNCSVSADIAITNRAIDEILKDDELSSKWQNYHLIGDVLRDEVPTSLQLDLSHEIANAIAQEATILSPNSSSTSANTLFKADEILANDTVDVESTTNVIQAKNHFLNISAKAKAKVVNFVKPLGQIAIAASAAGLMIIGVGQNVASGPEVITPSQVVQTMPLAGYANPVSFNYLSGNQNSVIEKQVPSGEQLTNKQKIELHIVKQRRLQALINDHQQQLKFSTSLK